MRIPPKAMPFLRGEEFSSAYRLALAGDADPLRERIGLICSLVKGKSVIHVGCADHLSTIPEKMRTGKWLHGCLANAASRLSGIDIDQDAVAYLAGLGTLNVHCLDVTRDGLPPAIVGQRWDVLVLGELLEHVDNPGDFLAAIRRRFLPLADSVLVSVPNAFRWSNFSLAMRRAEVSNSDHRHAYTPYTLARTLAASGFASRDVHFCVYEVPALSRRAILQQWFWKRRMSRHPLLRDVIVMTAGLS